jgi:3-deoxy-D-manno-octulosonic-acid transferase
VLPAFAALAGQSAGRRLRLLLVPHEPGDAHLAMVEAHCARLGLASVRLSGLEGAAPEPGHVPSVVLVDRVGVLAEMYARADAAYVGGAFGAGVHNVMEPAIMGLPVFFGPGYHNSPEAEALVEAGGATVIESHGDLERGLRGTLEDPVAGRRMGDRARLYVEANLGASRRCVERIRGIVQTSRPKEGS